jgi:hypothetical protein
MDFNDKILAAVADDLRNASYAVETHSGHVIAAGGAGLIISSRGSWRGERR